MATDSTVKNETTVTVSVTAFADRLQTFMRLICWQFGWHSPRLASWWMGISMLLLAGCMGLSPWLSIASEWLADLLTVSVVTPKTLSLIVWTISSGIGLVVLHWFDARWLSREIVRDLERLGHMSLLAETHGAGLLEVDVARRDGVCTYFVGGGGTALFFDALSRSGRSDMITPPTRERQPTSATSEATTFELGRRLVCGE